MAANGDTKELRLALVCYGGSSLAIYMHGVTKEIHRLVKGSSLLESGAPDSGTPSEQVYAQLLRELEKREHGVRTRVIVDIVAGTSAGGINGICLAKALAHNLSLDRLRDLWFKRGDINGLINISPLPFKLDRLVPKKLRAPLKLARLAVKAPGREPLRGKEMCQWIHDAFSGMESERPQPPAPVTLVAPGHRLQLFVTITDFFGYDRQVPNTDPNPIHDRRHRHALQFRYGNGEDDFGDDAGLTLAARTTSCIPGVFPPVSLQKLAEWIGPERVDTEALRNRYFRLYELADEPPEHTWFVDGGVLDNKPFGPVLRAIKERHAANEVDRYLIFLEPDPKAPDKPEHEPPAPKPIPALLGALSGLPRSEPILDELHDLLVRNERVRAVRDAIEANWGPIEERVLKLVPNLDELPADPGDPQLKTWSKGMHEAARALGELGYPMYVRLKISSAIDTFAGAACLVCDYTDSSNHAFLVRAVVRDWARKQSLFEHKDSPTKKQLEFVRDFDLEYAERRLHFVIAGVSWLYRDVGTEGHPSRQELDAVKERLYEAVAKLEWLSSGRGFADEVLGGVRTCFGEQRLREYLGLHRFDTNLFLESHGTEIDDLNGALRRFLGDELQTFTADLYRALIELTDEWEKTEKTKKIRRDLLIRYLGFPIWDAMLYPFQALSDVAERDAVRVARMSPSDSTLLTPVHQGGKVLGAQLGHAYAFFSRKARENDYLWGRLDAAERVVRLLLTEKRVEDGRDKIIPGTSHGDYRSWCKQVFLAVLAEDAAYLPTIEHDLEALHRQIEAL